LGVRQTRACHRVFKLIMGGLAVATLLTLIFLPALYVTWFRIKEPQSAITHNQVELSAMNANNAPEFAS
jgi:hypothetical protein